MSISHLLIFIPGLPDNRSLGEGAFVILVMLPNIVLALMYHPFRASLIGGSDIPLIG
jgi:hypothetical protein